MHFSNGTHFLERDFWTVNEISPVQYARQSRLTLFKIGFDGLFIATHFIRNVTPQGGRPSRHVPPAPSMPAVLPPRITLLLRSTSPDRWTEHQTEKFSAHAIKQSPAPLPRVFHPH